jgi:hypothetical protein
MPWRFPVSGIESEVKALLDSVASELEGIKQDLPWTELIYGKFVAIGKKHKFRVALSKRPADQAEWLFDVLWGQWTENTPMTRIGLIAECEWSPDRNKIRRDFDKLTVARSDHRVMIFKQSTRSDVKDMFSDLESRARAFEQVQPGDRFMLCGFETESSPARFHYHQFVI